MQDDCINESYTKHMHFNEL